MASSCSVGMARCRARSLPARPWLGLSARQSRCSPCGLRRRTGSFPGGRSVPGQRAPRSLWERPVLTACGPETVAWLMARGLSGICIPGAGAHRGIKATTHILRIMWAGPAWESQLCPSLAHPRFRDRENQVGSLPAVTVGVFTHRDQHALLPSGKHRAWALRVRIGSSLLGLALP